MPSASAHLDNLADFLEQQLTPFADEPDIQVDPWDESGTFAGKLVLPDGCELHVRLTVECARINEVVSEILSHHNRHGLT